MVLGERGGTEVGIKEGLNEGLREGLGVTQAAAPYAVENDTSPK